MSNDLSLRKMISTDKTFEDENWLINEAKYILFERLKKNEKSLTSSTMVRDYMSLQLVEKEHEVFCCLFLDNQHRLIEYLELFNGTIDGCNVYPREVVKAALEKNAAAVIFGHNHPSGVAEPSQADISITRRLKNALELVDIRVLDHLIVGDKTVTSLAERGLI